MSGFFSGVFGDSSSEGATGDSDQQSEGSATAQEASIEAQAQISAEASFQNEMSGSYGNLDGSSGSWSRSDEISFETDTQASLSSETLLTIDNDAMS